MKRDQIAGFFVLLGFCISTAVFVSKRVKMPEYKEYTYLYIWKDSIGPHFKYDNVGVSCITSHDMLKNGEAITAFFDKRGQLTKDTLIMKVSEKGNTLQYDIDKK